MSDPRKEKSTKPLDVVGRLGFGPGDTTVDLRQQIPMPDETRECPVTPQEFPTQVNKVIEAARCIRHWHNTGRNDEGMIVSAKKVVELWDALEEYDRWLEQSREQPAVSQGEGNG